MKTDPKSKRGIDARARTVKARFSKGVLEPLADLGLKEGEEVKLRIETLPPKPDADWLKRTAGGWVGLVDAEEIKRYVKESRLLATRVRNRGYERARISD